MYTYIYIYMGERPRAAEEPARGGRESEREAESVRGVASGALGGIRKGDKWGQH